MRVHCRSKRISEGDVLRQSKLMHLLQWLIRRKFCRQVPNTEQCQRLSAVLYSATLLDASAIKESALKSS